MEQVVLKKQYMLSCEAIYGEDDCVDPLLLLKDIPLTAAIEQIAYLLLRLTNIHKDDKKFHSSNLLVWMMKMSGTDQVKTLQFVTTNPIFNHPDFVLTDRRACLRLLQIILKGGSATNKELSKSDWGILFKSLLICNAIELKKQKDVFDWDNTGSIEDFINKILPVKMRNLEVDRRKDYKVQLLKVFYFFEFCQSDKEYKPYAESFLKVYDLQTYDQYIWNVLYPFLLMMTNNEITCKIQIDENNIGVLNFFNQFLINEKKVTIDEDYILLRQFPIFKSGSNTYTTFYINFLVDKLYQGFLFDFVSILRKSGYASFNYGQLKSDMGNRFSEIHLFYIVMKKCFQFYGDFRKKGTDLKTLLEKGEPDYFIRKSNEIFLFEFKDATLNANVKYSGNASTIKKELIEKFELTEQNGDQPQNKTVNQLKNSIVNILSSRYQQRSVDTFDPENVTIYPIFIFTDVVMEADGVNYFLKERLNNLIENNNLPKNRIKDLVLINLDTLILYQDLFRKSQIDLADCINSYITYVSEGDPANRVFPFDEYFKFYIVRKGFSIITIPEDFNDILKSFSSKNSSSAGRDL